MKSISALLDTFAQKINYVRRASMGVPKTFEIDLSIAATDFPYDLSGNIFYIWSAPDESSYVSIKVNGTAEPAIAYSVHTGLVTPFDKLLITTPAGQSGTIVIMYGTEAPELLRIIDNRSTTVAGVGGLLDELRGDLTPETWGPRILVDPVTPTLILAANAARKQCLIQQELIPAGEQVYLGFDNTVTTTQYFRCLMGLVVLNGTYFCDHIFRVSDYRGPIWGLATAANVYVVASEW